MVKSLRIAFRVALAMWLLLFSQDVMGDEREKSTNESSQLPWSFRPIQKPALPPVKDQSWARDDVDLFILARLEKAGLAPNADANRHTLIRRVAFDLTGLPPTIKEVDAYVRDRAGDDEALARVVDRYLSSPRFGERWGRHWLDVARYADNTGRTWNAPLTYAWRYRDYVIDSFNNDKPLNRFITEQLAGDLLPAKTVVEERENRTATGFLALGSLDLQSQSHEQFVLDTVDDQIDVTTRALLGLSVSCARCHDHKYDPISMRDYYALAGIFYSTATLPGVAHQQESGGEGYVHPSKLVRLPTGKGIVERTAGIHSMGDYQDEWRTGKRNIRFDTDPNLALGVDARRPRDCELRDKGEPYEKRAAPPRGDVRIPGLPAMPQIPEDEGGRLQLARWITSSDNPLTARVLANRVWQHLFGAGLVRTVDDFGANSEPPTHPELLDHLALRLRANDWSLKKFIRTLVLSRTYRLSTLANPASIETDPQNTLYWRMNRRRLEFEPLRDSLLEVAGRLLPDRPAGIQVSGIGGKSRQSQVASLLPVSSGYRTVYLPVLRAHLPDEFTLFDFPDPCLLQGQREVTTVAPQALFFMNSQFVRDCARRTAEELLSTAPADDRERVELAYRDVLRRPPEAEEVADALALVRGLDEDGETYRWQTLIQGLFASAEFRYLR